MVLKKEYSILRNLFELQINGCPNNSSKKVLGKYSFSQSAMKDKIYGKNNKEKMEGFDDEI